MAEELDKLEGSVTAILFQNKENGYTIMKLKVDGEEQSVVGVMPDVSPGECVAIQGEWVTHPTYGRQLKAQLVERKVPEGESEIFRYLSAGTINGVGKSTAKQLVEAFGEDVFDVMEHHPEKLTQIKGITEKRANKIHESYCKQMGTRRLLTFLTVHELPLSLAMPLTKFYGDMALKLIEKNPYLLTDEEFGLNFAKADFLAQELGRDKESPERLESALLFALRDSLGRGHSFLPREQLLIIAAELLDCKAAALVGSLARLEDKGNLFIEEVEGKEAFYLPSLLEAETTVALRLSEMSRAELLPPKKMDAILEKIQEAQQITYSPEQCGAVKMAAKHQIMLLTGGPGTGKTTSLKGVVALFQELNLEIALAAPTGRAAQRLGELCGDDASTIHRLLEAGFDSQTGTLVFQRDSDEPIKADAVIVDETSMVDVILMSHLLEALPNHCRLILVGDPDQLPSVGAGNVFGDLISSGVIPMVRLTQIFRQAQESNIISNAHMVNKGIIPDILQNKGDFFFLARDNPQSTLETIVDLCRRRLPEKMKIPVEQIQVLSPTRRHGTGTASLNKALQDALNPEHGKKNQRMYGNWLFREGDRVMQVKNNYDITWKDGNKRGTGVFNGDIGEVKKVASDMVTVSFDGKMVEYTTDLLSQLEPAYAITVHKAQGSEYHAVVFAAFDGAPMLLTRGVLYTAITRAKTIFIGVGNPEVLAKMTENFQQIHRFSGLQQRLLEE